MSPWREVKDQKGVAGAMGLGLRLQETQYLFSSMRPNYKTLKVHK